MLVVTVAALVAAPVAGAATYLVDRTDEPAGPGACTAAPGDCSLPQAIALANADAGADTVELAAASYLTAGVYATAPLTLAGAGARATVLHAVGLAVHINTPGAVEVRDMTITGARNGGPGYGAGLWGRDAGLALTLRRVAIVDNEQSGDPQFMTQKYAGVGAGIRWEGGTLVVEDSLIAGNHATTGFTGIKAMGAGLYLGTGSTVIRNTTIAGNVALGRPDAPAQGGGIYLADGRSLTLENVTLAGNAVVGGSEVTYGGTEGAQLWRGPTSAVTVRNSIIAHGSAPAATDCNGAVTSTGGGSVQDRNDCGLGLSDRTNADPLLGVLMNNGGPTDTMAIAGTSPAIGLAATCGLAADQRGTPRIPGACDSGGFEYVPPAGPPAPVVGPPPKPFCSMLASGDGAGLRALAICDLPVSVALTTTATIYPPVRRRGSKKVALRQVRLRVIKAGLLPGRFGTLRVAVPKSVRTALAKGQRVSIAMDLAATTAAGARGRAGASIRKLKRAPVKKKRR